MRFLRPVDGIPALGRASGHCAVELRSYLHEESPCRLPTENGKPCLDIGGCRADVGNRYPISDASIRSAFCLHAPLSLRAAGCDACGHNCPYDMPVRGPIRRKPGLRFTSANVSPELYSGLEPGLHSAVDQLTYIRSVADALIRRPLRRGLLCRSSTAQQLTGLRRTHRDS